MSKTADVTVIQHAVNGTLHKFSAAIHKVILELWFMFPYVNKLYEEAISLYTFLGPGSCTHW